MPEEEAFCVLVNLMTIYQLRDFYKPSMTDLSLCFYQLEKLIEVIGREGAFLVLFCSFIFVFISSSVGLYTKLGLLCSWSIYFKFCWFVY